MESAYKGKCQSQSTQMQRCWGRTVATVSTRTLWAFSGAVPLRTLFFHVSHSGSEPAGDENEALMVAAVVCGSQTRGDHCQKAIDGNARQSQIARRMETAAQRLTCQGTPM